MESIKLNCQLSRNIEKNPGTFEVNIDLDQTVYSLQKKIKEAKSEIFSDIKARDLHLWKVQEKNNDTDEIIEGKLSEIWNKQPSNDFIHVIVDSPLLSTILENKIIKQLMNRLSSIRDKESPNEDICNIENSTIEDDNEHTSDIFDRVNLKVCDILYYSW